MIISRVTDGLGNQMFQYALGRHLALKNNTDLKLDTCWYENNKKYPGTEREFTLDNFEIKASLASKKDIEKTIPLGSIGRKIVHSPTLMGFLVRGRSPGLRGSRFLPKGLGRRRLAESYNYVREYSKAPESGDPSWAYSRRFYAPVLNLGNGTYLHGYWQSYKYIEGIREELRDEFTPTSMSRSIKRIAEKIKKSTSVAVHVRRGDFIGQGPGSGNLLPKRYYDKAKKLIEQRDEAVEYYVFSDSPQWVSENRFCNSNSTHVSYEYSTKEYEDIYLMSLCKHNINANSTFSWWSGWLNDNGDKIVTIPSPWKKYGYPDGVVYEWDLFPEDWKVVEY